MSHFVTFQNSEEAAIASLRHINDTHPTGAFMESMNKVTSLEDQYTDQAAANVSYYVKLNDQLNLNSNSLKHIAIHLRMPTSTMTRM